MVAPQTALIITRLGVKPVDKEAAIREAAGALASAGVVDASYAESMLRRESTADTFLGAGVAIPHGMLEDKGLVKRDALAVIQIPKGLIWNEGQKVTLVVGIAASSDSHIALLRRLTGLIQDPSKIAALSNTKNAGDIEFALTGEDNNSQKKVFGPEDDLPEKVEWTLDYPAGLHARPVATWVSAAKGSGVVMRVRHAQGIADPRNTVSLLRLGARKGDSLVISASDYPGKHEAAKALQNFLKIISGLSVEEKAAYERMKEKAAKKTQGWKVPEMARKMLGVSAAPGLAIGTVRRLDATDISIPDKPVSLAEGGATLDEAIKVTRHQMKAMADDAARKFGATDAAIFIAQASILDDAELVALACRHLVAGHGVAWSWHEAFSEMANELAANENEILAARAADVRDIGRRVLLNLEPSLAQDSRPLPDGPVIIVGDDLSPSDTASLDRDKVVGIATSMGGPTAHTAILAKTQGLAAVVALGDNLAVIKDGDTLIVDGDGGFVVIDPDPSALSSARAYKEKIEKKYASEIAQRALPAVTTDGQHIHIAANINRPDQASLAINLGAEGVGLMRTEFLFLERENTPAEDEQFGVYKAMLEALEGRPLIVRTLDIGGDKQVAQLKLPHEENPFLGVRGSRLLLRRPDLLEPQIRALYRAAKTISGQADKPVIKVMFSMITTVSEVTELRQRCEKIRLELEAPVIPLGIMIEVPAAAILADTLAEQVDFFSIGTNDLTQYTLAMDRQNPVLAGQADSLHPAVLKLVADTVEGAKKYGRPVGVCGGLAGDPFGAALLIGLGVTELSMTPREIPAVKAVLRQSNGEALGKLALAALELENAEDVRALARDMLSHSSDIAE